jgi:hypothetical protein
VTRRRDLVFLAVVLLFQTVVVAGVFTPQPHPGGDNAGYVALAQSLADRGAYLELWDPAEPPHTKYPPLLSTLLAGLLLLGAKTWAALKLLPGFSTVLAVAFTFLWARERNSPWLAVAVAVLLGLSESVVYYSQWVLSDPTFLALTMAALWALERGRSDEVGGAQSETRLEEAEDEPGASPTGIGSKSWIGAAMVLAVGAYLTRSAGLPLVVAIGSWLLLRRRWGAVTGFGVLFGIPALLWLLRGRGLGGDTAYASEFWLLDPYQPHLGTVGFGGLVGRAWENALAYVTTIIPGGIVGDGFPLLMPLGLGLVLLALVGWIRSLGKGPGPAELFLPLYFGLILLWPTAWSGDRFSLPLLPFLFFYSGQGLLWLMVQLRPSVTRGVLAGLMVLVLLPAAGAWRGMAESASQCREATMAGNPRGCLGPALGEYYALAEWSGKNLPDGAVVTTRKPRTFFVMSGVKARSIPLEADREAFLDRLRNDGVGYVSLDLLDRVSGYYVYPAVLANLGAFCGLVEVGGEGRTGTQLLGFTGDAAVPSEEETGPVLLRCPAAFTRADPLEPPDLRAWEIPLLVWEY